MKDAELFSNLLVAMTPGGIERQEADGQRELAMNDMLPKEIIGITREQLTEIGFLFGDDIDDLFVRCSLPPGWKKVATSHTMWCRIVDGTGKTRAEIFLKAAFYDRKAFLSWRD